MIPNMIKKSSINNSILFGLLFFSLSSFTEEIKEQTTETEVQATETEDKTEYIKDITKEYESFDGYIQAYQDPKTSSIYFSLKKDQLNKEFIYFAHVTEGVVAARKNRGSYLDNGVFKFEKHFETIRLIRVNTAFSLDKNSALIRSSGANISDSVVHVFSIKSKDKDGESFLINVSVREFLISFVL